MRRSYSELWEITHPAFWDCECDEDHIRIKTVTLHCEKCGADEDDMPDSHTNEILYMLLDQARALDSVSNRHLKMVKAVFYGAKIVSSTGSIFGKEKDQ